MRANSLVPWPEHMKAIFRKVGGLTEGRQLRPEHLSSLQPNDPTIVPDHKVTVSHIPKTRTGGKQGRYVVIIEGPRISGRGDLLPGAMRELVKRTNPLTKTEGRETYGELLMS